MTEHSEIIMSPLCQSFESGGIAVQVDIYRSQDSDWALEVVNPSNTSIVWDRTFLSDRAALDEFHRTIRVDGIRSLLDEES